MHEPRLGLIAAHAVARAGLVRRARLHERFDGERDPRGEAAGASHVARQRHHARVDGGARGETAGDGERAVGAGVVDDDQAVGLACLPVDACEAFGKQVFAIVGDHDGGDGIAHGSKHTRGNHWAGGALSGTLITMLMADTRLHAESRDDRT